LRSTTAHGIALPFERAPVSTGSTTLFGKLLPLPVVIGVYVYPLLVLLYYRGKFAAVDVDKQKVQPFPSLYKHA
jgi:hypothetical protein